MKKIYTLLLTILSILPLSASELLVEQTTHYITNSHDFGVGTKLNYNFWNNWEVGTDFMYNFKTEIEAQAPEQFHGYELNADLHYLVRFGGNEQGAFYPLLGINYTHGELIHETGMLKNRINDLICGNVGFGVRFKTDCNFTIGAQWKYVINKVWDRHQLMLCLGYTFDLY